MKDGIYENWRNQHRNVLCIAPTGSGKTALMSSIFVDFQAEPCIAIAHRQELVLQISMAFAKAGILHRVIAPLKVVRFIISQHVKEYGKNYIHENSPVAVAAVQTVTRRKEQLKQWMSAVKMWAQDEAHHVAPKNQWWTAALCFPNALGLGVTASPIRSDRKPLGYMHGGMFHVMVVGPSMRFLIDQGYLADYRIFAPNSPINFDAINVSKSTGEFKKDELIKETTESTITGDIVDHYKRIAMGKRGITFTVDVASAKETARKFNEAGVPADAVSGDTPDDIRQNSIGRFKDGQLLQLVNVDLFGEGFDVPAAEVVSMGRATQSYGLYIQQFGRGLRPFEGKDYGIILDHAGNVKRHGLPDKEQNWSFDMFEKSAKKDNGVKEIPVTTCMECFFAYEAITKTCPMCGHVDEPMERSGPQFVDGDLTELTPEVLAAMRGNVETILNNDDPVIPYGASTMVENSVRKLHRIRQETIQELRDVINMWAGVEVYGNGRTDSESYRVFQHKFGVDAVSCQELPAPEMRKLMELIRSDLT